MRKGRTVLQAKRYGTSQCSARAALLVVARRMDEDDISTLVVVDERGYLVGIITRTDLLRAMVEREDWTTQPVEAYMTRDVVTVTPNTLLMDVAKTLLSHHIHRVVVVDEETGDRRPLAVISAGDVVYHMVMDATGG